MNQRIILKAGKTLEVQLPSGKVISVEATEDTATVVKDDVILFNEDLQYDGSGWQQDWPKAEAQAHR